MRADSILRRLDVTRVCVHTNGLQGGPIGGSLDYGYFIRYDLLTQNSFYCQCDYQITQNANLFIIEMIFICKHRH